MGHLHQMKTALRTLASQEPLRGDILPTSLEEHICDVALKDLKTIETAVGLIRLYENCGVKFDFLNIYTTQDKE